MQLKKTKEGANDFQNLNQAVSDWTFSLQSKECLNVMQ